MLYIWYIFCNLKKGKLVWPGNATLTDYRQTHDNPGRSIKGKYLPKNFRLGYVFHYA